MDGFTGFKTATTEEFPEAVPSWTPSVSSGSPATPSISAGGASSKTPAATGDAKTTRSTVPTAPCADLLNDK